MSFRAWGPKQNFVYALSVAAASVAARQPAGFANGGGQCKIKNSGANPVLVAFYKYNGSADPTLVFPVTGAPPTGQNGNQALAAAVVVLAGEVAQISIPLNADSFVAIGSAAGPAIIYVQRGDGSV